MEKQIEGVGVIKKEIPNAVKELANDYLQKKTLNDRLKIKAQIRALFEFLDPETDIRDYRKFMRTHPEFDDETMCATPVPRGRLPRGRGWEEPLEEIDLTGDFSTGGEE